MLTITKKVLSASETAAILGCSVQKIYHLIHTKQLVAYKDEGGHPWRVPEYCVENYIAARLDKTALEGLFKTV